MKTTFDQIRKNILRKAVAAFWPILPVWSTLDHAVIKETEHATLGSGVVLLFEENGEYYVVLGEAGAHYKNLKEPAYTIPGGFVNLTFTPGSELVPASDKPENAFVGAAREGEEEFKLADGTPLLAIDPARLKLMDTDTLAFPTGEKRIVLGMLLELASSEVTRIKAHVARLASDPAYKVAVATQTLSPSSAKPEIGDIKIFKLDDIINDKHALLHKDQMSLFKAVQKYLLERKPRRRTSPTYSYTEKVRSLESLQTVVKDLRRNGNPVIGITTGAYDILHPGHISFLEDASRQCDHLIVAVAPDSTVRQTKGSEKPYISELKRAQTLAALSMVDSVIISDECDQENSSQYGHKRILEAIKPDVMFKGDEYADIHIYGSELCGHVALIPCAEKDFNSSSEFVRKIKQGEPDHSPAWGPQ